MVDVITEITAIRRSCASNIMSNRTILIISLNVIYMYIYEFGRARVCVSMCMYVPTWQELSLHIAWRYSVVSGALGNRHEIRFIKETLHFFLECSCSTANCKTLISQYLRLPRLWLREFGTICNLAKKRAY